LSTPSPALDRAADAWIRANVVPTAAIETAHERPWTTVLRVPLADGMSDVHHPSPSGHRSIVGTWLVARAPMTRAEMARRRLHLDHRSSDITFREPIR
jgi:hypothetical protein